VAAREKLEAWLAKQGKTPSRYRHMMCFGHTLGLSHGHVGHSDGRMNSKSTKPWNIGQHGVKREVGKSSSDQVACSLFMVTESLHYVESVHFVTTVSCFIDTSYKTTMLIELLHSLT